MLWLSMICCCWSWARFTVLCNPSEINIHTLYICYKHCSICKIYDIFSLYLCCRMICLHMLTYLYNLLTMAFLYIYCSPKKILIWSTHCCWFIDFFMCVKIYYHVKYFNVIYKLKTYLIHSSACGCLELLILILGSLFFAVLWNPFILLVVIS